MRPLELDVLYVRRLPADESTVEARAEVIHQTRRFLLVRGEVLDPEGRRAALLRASLARPG
jgi:acyl-coenzyme A thioesterase PaaI-like protein